MCLCCGWLLQAAPYLVPVVQGNILSTTHSLPPLLFLLHLVTVPAFAALPRCCLHSLHSVVLFSSLICPFKCGSLTQNAHWLPSLSSQHASSSSRLSSTAKQSKCPSWLAELPAASVGASPCCQPRLAAAVPLHFCFNPHVHPANLKPRARMRGRSLVRVGERLSSCPLVESQAPECGGVGPTAWATWPTLWRASSCCRQDLDTRLHTSKSVA